MALATANFYIVIGEAPPPPCTEGNTKCVGTDQYICTNSQWVLKETNSPSCQGPAPSPIPDWIYYALGGAAVITTIAVVAKAASK